MITNDTIDPLHIMGMQPIIWRTKQKKFSLLGIEIYSHVKKSYCSVLQIGCISMHVQWVSYTCCHFNTLHNYIKATYFMSCNYYYSQLLLFTDLPVQLIHIFQG